MVYCGKCGMEVPRLARDDGRTGQCPSCGASVPLPAENDNDAKFYLFCPGCQVRLNVSAKRIGQDLSCPRCQASIHLPDLTFDSEPGAEPSPPAVAEPEPASVAPRADGQLCAICQAPFEPDEPIAQCPACHTRYHQDCWRENRGCAVYGCSEVPKTEHLSSVEIPVSYWGQENKPCPVCGKEILAAALRCRHCGTIFESAKPMAHGEYVVRQAREEKYPKLRKQIVALFVFCLIPCTAPIAFIIGLFWYRSNREIVKELPSVFGGLCKIGLAVAAGQTLFTLLMLLIHGNVTGALF